MATTQNYTVHNTQRAAYFMQCPGQIKVTHGVKKYDIYTVFVILSFKGTVHEMIDSWV